VLVLEFDHVRGVKKSDICKLANRPANLETLADEIEKCDVRCANCHRRRTVKELKWFRHGIPGTKGREASKTADALADDFHPEYSCLVLAPLAQSVEQRPFKPCVARSNRAGRIKVYRGAARAGAALACAIHSPIARAIAATGTILSGCDCPWKKTTRLFGISAASAIVSSAETS
jgi:hypothetical protein